MEQTINLENQNSDQILNQTPPRNNNYKILFFVSLGLLLIISSVLATLLITQKPLLPTQTTDTQETKPTTSIPSKIIVTPTTVTTPIESSATTSSIPKDWKTYTSKEIGFSFKYPPQLKFADPKMEALNILVITSVLQSPQDTDTFISSVNSSIISERGGGFADAAPYTKSGNNITYGNSWSVDPRNIKKIYTNPNGVEIVLINDTGKFSSGGEDEPDYNDFTKYGNTGALINTKSKIYPGLTFKINSVIKEADLLKILDTLKFN